MDFNSNDNDQTVIVNPDMYGQMPPQMMNEMYGQPQSQPTPNNMYGQPQPTPNNMYGQPQPTPNNMYGQPQPQPTPNNMYGQPQPMPNNMYNQPQQPQFNTYNQPMQMKAPNNTPPKKKKTGLIIGIIAAVILIAGGIVAAILLTRSKGNKGEKAAKKPIEQYFEGVQDEDIDTASEAFYPTYRTAWVDGIYASAGAYDNDSYWANEKAGFGDDLEITYEIIKTDEFEDIDDLVDSIDSFFGEEPEVKEAYSFVIEETYEGKNGKVVLQETFYSGKVDGEWYIVYVTSDKVITNTLEATEAPTTEAPTTEAPTTEAPTTEAPTTEAPTTPAAPTGAWDWRTMSFTFNGVAYDLGSLTYADIQAMGFTMDETFLNQDLEDYQYTFSETARSSDGSSMYVRFKNFTGNGTRKVRDCEILGISFSLGYSNTYSVALSNGITSGMSMDDCRGIMGTEKDSYTSDDGTYSSLTYEESDQAYANNAKFSFSNGALIEIDIECYDE